VAKDTVNVFIPRAGIIFNTDSSRWISKLLYNEGFRRPSWQKYHWVDGFWGGPASPTNSETIKTVDFQNIVRLGEKVKLSANLFSQTIDKIAMTKGTSRDNLGEFVSKGVETEAAYEIKRNSVVGVNAAIVDSEFKGVNKAAVSNTKGEFLGYPMITANAFFDWSWTEKLYSSIIGRYLTSWPGRELGVDTEVKNILYVDLSIGIENVFENFDLALTGRNIANNRKVIPMGQDDENLYQPAPRYVELKATYKF
jgi:outer membrane receptor protein involved in Fe transport